MSLRAWSFTKSSSLFLFLIVITMAFMPALVLAQESSGIGLAPASIEDRVEPGQVFQQDLTLTNLSDTVQEYYVFTRDIEGVRNGGVPIFANEGIETTGFEMSEWIVLPENQPFVVNPGAEVTVPVQIFVPEDASPGSHFAGIFASIEPPEIRSTGASVGYSVVSVASLLIAGDTFESVSIREFSTESRLYGSADVNFNLRIENKGNVLARPFGPLEITNMFGKRVELLTANEDLNGVFPGTVRDFELNWSSDTIGFGQYTAEIGLVYGGGDEKRSIGTETTFWVLPMNIIGPALIVLLVLFLVVYFGVRVYIRNTVRRLSGGRATKVRGRSRRAARPMSPTLLVLVVFMAVSTLFLLILLVLFA